MLPASALPDTVAVHAGRDDLSALGVHVPPIDLSTTNPLPEVGLGGDCYEALATGGTPLAGGSHVYQRLWNPTTARFEEALARLEHTAAGVAFASGMAAITACLLAAAAEGKRHVVAVRPLYGGSDHLLASGLLGTEVSWASAGGVAAARRPDTGLVVVETPANPTLELLDLARIAEQCGDVPLLVDNTFATPILQRPAEYGATLVVHSATKYLGGHGDVLGGVVATTEEWAARLRPIRAITGSVLHPLSAYLLHRGLQTLPLRVRHQSQNAQKLVDRLLANPAVERVYYPGLPDCDPQHLVGRQMSGPGAVFAMSVRGGYAAAARTADSVRLITHAVSLGGVDTLIQHPASLTHRPVAADAKPHASVLRVSVGLEDTEDLYADLERALRS
ncbi:MAG: PLP-dependent transferase [Catenulispora sp.]|nr:PLP-dependent transferase [Catenulispora sp.]